MYVLKTTWYRILVGGLFEAECLVYYFTLIHLCGLNARIFEIVPKNSFSRKFSYPFFTYQCCRYAKSIIVHKNFKKCKEFKVIKTLFLS